MSYPYTKPQSRYGFRRRWNDPNVGIVGSGPGRPLRRYATDAEVGLPQRGAGLGSSEASPVTQGIFNVGPAKGFSRGVFTPDPPWATPRYIASMPDGVNGLGGCCGLGQTADPCGLDKIKNIIVSKITSELPTFQVDLLVKKITIDKSIVGPALKSVLDGMQTPVLSAIDSAANAGISAIRTALTTYVTPLIVSAAKAALPSDYASYANLLGSLIDNAMAPLYGKVAAEIRTCKGLSPTGVAMTQAQACATYGLVPDSGYGYGMPIVVEGKTHLCEKATTAQQQMTLVTMQQLDQSMSPVDLNKMSTVDLSKLTTVAAEQAKCASAGGAWYPGGADCAVDEYGTLYDCVPPTSATLKLRYCVPKGTAGAIDASTAAAAGAASSSNLPLILGAGAAIVALLLLTK